MKELTIQYGGGSGGFLLLHLILLGSKYRCLFKGDQEFDLLFKEQWNIQDHHQWKSSEVWPNNPATLASDFKNRIYFCCNPGDTTFPFEARGRRIVLYTDLRSQIKLCRYKNSYFYSPKSAWSRDLELQRLWRNHYNNIKDPFWPKCLSTRQFFSLPEHIRKEVGQHRDTVAMAACKNYDDYLYRLHVTWYHDTPVDYRMLPYLMQAHDTVSLQELVNDTNATLRRLGFEKTNKAQQKLVDHWCSLHSPLLLKSIGIHAR